ncbi:MAG: hypothetical protein ACI8TP_004104 [Acidimicrobiales bacterium]
MAVFLLIIAAVLVIAIALLFVGWAVGKTNEMPDQIVVDAHESIEFCAEALPVEVSSVLSYEELAKILRLHLEWIQAFHYAPEGIGDDTPIVFEEFDAVDYIMERADVNHFIVERPQVEAVVDVHSSYLQVMGAIHVDDPVRVSQDLAELPLLDMPELDAPGEPGDELGPGK